MNPKNRWIDLADRIPQDVFEVEYAELFSGSTGNVAKSLHMSFDTLIIQTKFQYSDHEPVEQITENPYLQYFTVLLGYQKGPSFDARTRASFRKRLTHEIIMEADGYIMDCQDDNRTLLPSGSRKDEALGDSWSNKD